MKGTGVGRALHDNRRRWGIAYGIDRGILRMIEESECVLSSREQHTVIN